MRAGWLRAIGLAAVAWLLAPAMPASAQDRAAVPIVDTAKIREQQATVARQIEAQLGPQRSFALVLGISEFDDRAWPDLGGVRKEVEEIAASLAAQKFSVTVAPGNGRVTAAELRATIQGFIRANGGDAANRLVIYVATHGHRAPKGSRQYGYLVASDSPAPGAADFASRAYSVDDLSNELLANSAQHVFLFFNACFSGLMVPEITLRSEEAAPRIEPPKAPPLSPETADWTLELLAHNARLVLTAGSDDQQVPDRDNPFSKAVIDGLNGMADADDDGLVLGSELAQYVRGRVARETRRAGRTNDPVFAVLPKLTPPAEPRGDLPAGMRVDYKQEGDFIFLSPRGAGAVGASSGEAAILEARMRRLPSSQFTTCADCPVMVRLPQDRASGKAGPLAVTRTEITFAEWDACYRELGCRRYMDDGGRGRGDRPVGGVTWQDALEYVRWLSGKADRQCGAYRIPTPEEWQQAALGGARSRFPWGDDAGAGRAICDGCGGPPAGGPARVASVPANGYGLFDMTGNLWEWVDDPAAACDPQHMLENNRCELDGQVMGGAYSTSVAALDPRLSGSIPRTASVPESSAWSLPTVGLRVACTPAAL